MSAVSGEAVSGEAVSRDRDGGDWLVDATLAPLADGSLAPLYAGAAAGDLTLPFCVACGLAVELEQRACDGCGATEIRWRPVERVGTVHAVTTVHRAEPGLIRAADPYHVLDVEVASGHRLVMATVVPTGPAPAIGSSVTVTFRDVGGVAVPSARPSAPVPPAETEVSP